MTRSILSLALLGLALATPPASADEWVSPDGSVRLDFRPDGTFVWEAGGTRSEGRFAEREGLLVLTAADGTSAAYRVNQPRAGRIELVDAQGTAHPFVRVEDDPVLLRAGDLVLRASDFQTACTLAALLVDRPLAEGERARLLEASRRDFPVDPAGFLAQVQEVRRAIEPILATADPLRIAELQQALLAEIHLSSRSIPAESRPEIVRLMDENVRVLSIDAENRLVLTGRAADAFLALGDLEGRVAGRTPLSSCVDRAEVERSLAERFEGGAIEEKRGLCSLPVAWKVIEYNWTRLGEAERARLAANLGFETAREPDAAAPPGVDAAKGDLLQRQADLRSRQQMFDMMNRMSLQQHVTSLNIIENMGGVGNYWEVVERP